ncbi:MAG: hypothetical protein DDT37_01339 [Firmicutes bacterium]|nr:hypothetical protein [candidate division NPL-UPA2 bacterium]MBT9154332.1 hypothetical protein [candidate division NPL-UPA2 bacterium]MBT9156354.1 hypothetical protein [candidate division NPL-UPA2 bacterium]
MLVHDKAHELARAFRSSPEYQALLTAQGKLSNDTQSLEMFKDYRKKEIAYQTALMSGQQVDEAEMKSLQKLAEIINLNSLVRDYIQAEARFGIIFADVQRIVGDAVKEVSALYKEAETEGGSN